MPDPDQSREAVHEEAFKERLLSAVESLRPGVRQLSDDQDAVITEYEHIKAQLAGPSFGPVAPQITRYVREDGKVRIYGTNLRDARVVNVAGARITRADFRFNDGEQPHIEADVPSGAAAGPITVFTSGGLATSRSHFGVGDSPPATEAGAPARESGGAATEAGSGGTDSEAAAKETKSGRRGERRGPE